MYQMDEIVEGGGVREVGLDSVQLEVMRSVRCEQWCFGSLCGN